MTIYNHTSEVQDRIIKLVSEIESDTSEEVLATIETFNDFEDVDFLDELLRVKDVVEGRDYIDSDVEELIDLLNFKDEVCDSNSEWNYGGTQLILKGNGEDYFQSFTEEIGDLPRNLPSYIVIDWKATAENLLQDCTEVVLSGTEYYVRCT